MSLLDEGAGGIALSWEPYALIAVAVLGTYLQQSSYQAGSLAQALPAAAVLEPVVAVVLGIALLSETLQADGPQWMLIGASAVAMALATFALARAQAEAETGGEADPVPTAAAA